MNKKTLKKCLFGGKEERQEKRWNRERERSAEVLLRQLAEKLP